MTSKAHYEDGRTAEALIVDINGLRTAALRYSKRVAILVADATNDPDGNNQERVEAEASYALYQVREHLRCMAGELRRLRRKLGIQKVTPVQKARERLFSAERELNDAKRTLAVLEPKSVQP